MGTNHPGKTRRDDAAIVDPRFDILERKGFARSLARSINAHRVGECLVTAICGPWGDGKTSVANMVISYLPSANKGGPNIIRFNPWQLTDHDLLTRDFFEVLEPALESDNLEETKKRINLWRGLGTLVNVTKLVSNAVTRTSQDPGVQFVAAAVNTGSQTVGALIPETVDYLEKKTERNTWSLKQSLAKSLKENGRRTLVIIDDIDRLLASEIATLFRVIKSNADLPNLQFLLLFQSDVVEKALDRETDGQGRQFLEKIVQISVSIPVPQEARLSAIAQREMRVLLRDKQLTSGFDVDRWREVYNEGCKFFLSNVRKIKRFYWSYDFRLDSYLTGSICEVNVIDLFVLEILRIFEPFVANQLWHNRNLLLTSGLLQFSEGPKKTDQDRLNKLLDLASKEHRNEVRTLLGYLFPKTVWLMGGSRSESFGFAELRICDYSHFEKYFTELTPPDELSQKRIASIINACSEKKNLNRLLKKIQKDDLDKAFIVSIHHFLNKIPVEHIQNFVEEVVDFSETLEGDDLSYSVLDSASDRIEEILFRMDVDPRCEMLCQVASACRGVYLIAKIAAREIYRREKPREKRTLFEGSDMLERFSKIVSARISQMRFENFSRATSLLAYWSIIDKDMAKSWATGMLADGKTIELLMMFVVPAPDDEPRLARKTGFNKIWINTLSSLINLEELQAKLTVEPVKIDTPKKLLAFNLFMKNVERIRDKRAAISMTLAGDEREIFG